VLRPYQQRAIELLYEHRAGRPLLALATGAGKTVCFAHVVRQFASQGCRALVVAHRRELIHQAHARLAALGIDAGLILAGERPSDRAVQVASIQTLARRDPPAAELVVVDEAHHAVGASYQRLLETYPRSWIIGATATPFRLDGRGLGAIFTAIVAPVTVQELVDAGTLIAPTVYAPASPDLAGVRTVAGDFDGEQIAERMSGLTGNVVEHWLRLSPGRRTVAFAVNVDHSRAIVARFQAAGVAAAHLDGSSTTQERESVLADLRAGRITLVSNCNLFGEGWDLPALETAILARPTKSLCLHLQQVGRVMRAAEGKRGALVLDHAGNTHRHGLVTDPIEFSLDARVRKESAASHRTCRSCYAIVELAATSCPQCGASFAAADLITPVPSEAKGELVPITRVDKEAEYRVLVLHASAKRLKLGWARNAYRAKFQVWPRGFKDIDALYECPEHDPEVKPWPIGTRCKRCLRSLPRSAVRA
jgi:DNA repair protein RadD